MCFLKKLLFVILELPFGRQEFTYQDLGLFITNNFIMNTTGTVVYRVMKLPAYGGPH